ncbi:hypothetical protein GN958_ATG16628 [Phytophthora infestans]|uniref:Uncharacterized protein n=1 Tax=Phytophthora infestans TaxID=4787 RepID=A0A8S9U1I7_PHYIN|nr:hypothetical protein GN958_ATG16628 [Phytophthora infestans]
MVRDLVSLRYDTYWDRFGQANNNAALKKTGLLLATALSRHFLYLVLALLSYTSQAVQEQDIRATGNVDTEVVKPPGSDLVWVSKKKSTCMNAQTLASSEADDVVIRSEADSDSDGERPRQGPDSHRGKSKNHRTMGLKLA